MQQELLFVFIAIFALDSITPGPAVATVMDVSHLTMATATQFSVAIILIWGGVLVGYTALADRGRQYFKNSSMQTWLNRGAAGAMAGAAGSIAFRE